jgi:uncharacterized protein YfbU (UPF0304 family)
MANDIPDDIFKRLVLANQYKILALLDKASADDWEAAAEIASEFQPYTSLPGMDSMLDYRRDPLTVEEQDLVMNALEVFAILQDAEKAGCKPPAPYTESIFPGFDGNNETKLMGYARDLRNRQHKWQYVQVASKDLNSHHPTVDMYERMIEAWQEQGRPHKLTEDQYAKILGARSYPE